LEKRRRYMILGSRGEGRNGGLVGIWKI